VKSEAYIYALLDKETQKVRYIGCTTDDVKHRVRLHWTSRYQKSTPIAVWLRDFDEPPECFVLNTVPAEESRWDVEEYYIRVFRQSPGIKLLNVTDRRSNPKHGFKHSEETRKKISQSHNQIITPELREIRRQQATGRRHTLQIKESDEC
jgi:hypothetical protein